MGFRWRAAAIQAERERGKEMSDTKTLTVQEMAAGRSRKLTACRRIAIAAKHELDFCDSGFNRFLRVAGLPEYDRDSAEYGTDGNEVTVTVPEGATAETLAAAYADADARIRALVIETADEHDEIPEDIVKAFTDALGLEPLRQVRVLTPYSINEMRIEVPDENGLHSEVNRVLSAALRKAAEDAGWKVTGDIKVSFDWRTTLA